MLFTAHGGIVFPLMIAIHLGKLNQPPMLHIDFIILRCPETVVAKHRRASKLFIA
jgi:hypothetical protein